MKMFNNKICVQTPADLTEENLTKIFQYYLRDEKVRVKIVQGDETFTGKYDGFQSEIKKWTIELEGGNVEKKQLVFIVKTTLKSQFHGFNSRLARQFFSETFWYKHALPVN